MQKEGINLLERAFEQMRDLLLPSGWKMPNPLSKEEAVFWFVFLAFDNEALLAARAEQVLPKNETQPSGGR